MTNLPPEHRGPRPDDSSDDSGADIEPGNFVEDPTEQTVQGFEGPTPHLRPPGQVAGYDPEPPAPYPTVSGAPNQSHAAPPPARSDAVQSDIGDPSSTGQFPAFTDRAEFYPDQMSGQPPEAVSETTGQFSTPDYPDSGFIPPQHSSPPNPEDRPAPSEYTGPDNVVRHDPSTSQRLPAEEVAQGQSPSTAEEQIIGEVGYGDPQQAAGPSAEDQPYFLDRELEVDSDPVGGYPETGQVQEIEEHLLANQPAATMENVLGGPPSLSPTVPDDDAGALVGEPNGDAATFNQDLMSVSREHYFDDDLDDVDLPARVLRKIAKRAQPPSKIRQLHSERDSDSGWSYLAVLLALFLLVVGFSWGCSAISDADKSLARNPDVGPGVSTEVTVFISGDQVRLSGTVGEQDLVSSLVSLVGQHYEAESVVDGLTVDSSVSADQGTVVLAGSADTGDSRPTDLQTTLEAEFDLPVTGNTVAFGDSSGDLATVAVEIAESRVVLTGELPDQEKLDLVKGAAEEVWGAENVDSSGLSIGSVVWEGGRISVVGDVPLGNAKPGQFAEKVGVDGITVDTSGAERDLESASKEEIIASIAQRLEANPIVFDTGSIELTEEHKATLDAIAEALLALPGQEVKIFGYGDGGTDIGQGKDRAGIVWSYLQNFDGIDGELIDFEGAAGEEPSQIKFEFP